MSSLPASVSEPTAAPLRSHQIGAYKWYVAFALSIAHSVSFADRFVMVLVTEPVRHELNLSDFELGLLQGTGFALLYCGFALPLGAISDALHRRRLITVGLVIWSVATVCAAFTSSFLELLITRVFVGMGEACLIPAAMSLLASYFPQDKLARGTAIFGVGANLGNAVAFIGGGTVLAALTATNGLTLPGGISLSPWQGVFFSAGFLALPVLALLAFVREPPRSVRAGTDKPSTQIAAMGKGFAYIYDNLREYAPYLFVTAANAAISYGFNSWSVSLWTRLHAATPAQAGQYVGVVGLIAGPLGTILGGIILDKLQKTGVRAGPLLVIACCAVGMVLAAAGFVISTSPFWTFAFFSLFIFLSFFSLPSSYVGMQQLTPDHARGIAASFNMMIYTLVGLGLGPTVIGIVSDLLGGQTMLGESVLLVQAVLAVMVVAVSLLSRNTYHGRVVAVQAIDNGKQEIDNY